MARHALPLSLVPTLLCLSLGRGGLALPPPADAAPGDVVSARLTATDTRVHVYDLLGHVELVAAPGHVVTVDARFGGKDGHDMRINTLTKNGTAFVVQFPSDHLQPLPDVLHSNTTLTLNDDGTFRDRDRGWSLTGRRVRIDDKAGALQAWADLRIAVPAGQALDVHVGMGRATVTNVEGQLVVSCASGAVSVNGARGELAVSTGSGDIQAIDVQGRQSFETGSGDLRASRLTGPTVTVGTGSGMVSVEQVDSPLLRAETGSGDMTLGAVAADDLMLQTGSGDVSVALTRRAQRVRVSTGSGGVRIAAPQDLGATVRVETGSGGIDSDFPLRNVRRDRGQLAAVIGDGRGTISVETGSGSVTLLRR